jgi:6,7-dimethyl-8-ribityllumazine synthase
MDTISTIGDLAVNGRTYKMPRQPVVVVCVDGSEPGYIERAVEAGRAPWFAEVLEQGTSLIGDCVVPSFTNPNNLSIVTGQPPAVHGICGNYFLDPETGKEVMMNDPKFLRVETLFPAFQRAGLRIAVVVARFNDDVTSKMLAGAREALAKHSVADFDIAWVPGAFELPVAARRLAESRRYDAVVCLGAVIRGETPHFEYIAAEAARGIGQVAQDTGVPTIFGVITPNTLEQALDRAGGKVGNKGYDAAVSAIEMANLMRQLRPD